MRRLNELITFPRPWYRKQLVRRLFFGEHSVPANPSTFNTHYSNMQRPYSACSSVTAAHSAELKFIKKNNTTDTNYFIKNQNLLKSISSDNYLGQRFLHYFF